MIEDYQVIAARDVLEETTSVLSLEVVRSALEAAGAAVDPLAKIVVTQKMWEAGVAAQEAYERRPHCSGVDFFTIYRAMHTVSPKPQEVPVDAGIGVEAPYGAEEAVEPERGAMGGPNLYPLFEDGVRVGWTSDRRKVQVEPRPMFERSTVCGLKFVADEARSTGHKASVPRMYHRVIGGWVYDDERKGERRKTLGGTPHYLPCKVHSVGDRRQSPRGGE